MRIREGVSQMARSKTMLTLGVVMAAGVTLFSAGLLSWRHGDVVDKAKSDLANVSSLLATHSDQAFQAIDVVQSALIESLLAKGARSADDLRRIASTEEAHKELLKAAASMDMLDAVSVIDDRGQLLNFSRGWPIPDVNVSDRDYFRALSSSEADGYWSAPVKNRGNGTWTVYRARRINGPDGALIGMLLGMLSVDRIERHYASVLLPPGSSISLYRADGLLLARDPPADRGAQTRSQAIARLSGALAGQGPADHVLEDAGSGSERRITDVRKVPSFPLLIAASSPRDAVLAGWRREATAIGALALVLNLTIAIATLLGLRQLRVSERAFRTERHAARHDALTGLPNRSYFKQRLDAMFADRRDKGTEFALLMIDLDYFKEVNDSLGHAAGDELLRIISQRLGRAVRDSDFVARLGGDEFAVIHADGGGGLNVAAVAERILETLSAPIRAAEAEIRISCSIGAAVAGDDADEAAQLLIQADLALFRAKDAGRGAIRAYSRELGAERTERSSLLRDLRSAVEAGGLELHFQPIVDMQLRRIAAFEALLRWRHPTRGLVSPARFIPLAEESGMIGRIGAWVLDEACRQALTWPDHIRVAVNLSAAQLRLQDVYAQTYAALATCGLQPRRLVLEITESVQLDQTQAGLTLRNLRDLGVGVSLDDFGTGYASLSYLRSFPFDLIKIDQSFVREMHRSVESQIIVETVIALARRLGIAVTAEGVETFEQLEALRLLACPKVQGYLLGMPMPASALERFIAEWRYPEPGAFRPFALVS